MTMMPIGKFARATRLSVKALRNYDRLGLLAPAHVDPGSGYRYYRLDQMRRADAIRMLRIADVPLSEIAEVLDGSDPEKVLSSHLEALANQRDEQERKLRYLEQLITRKELTMTHDVVVKVVDNNWWPHTGPIDLPSRRTAPRAHHRTPVAHRLERCGELTWRQRDMKAQSRPRCGSNRSRSAG